MTWPVGAIICGGLILIFGACAFIIWAACRAAAAADRQRNDLDRMIMDGIRYRQQQDQYRAEAELDMWQRGLNG